MRPPDDNLVRFHAATDDYLEAYYDAHPCTATYMGVPGRDDLLPNVSRHALDADLRKAREYLHAIDKLSVATMAACDRVDYRLARSVVQMRIFEFEQLRPHERQPAWYIDDALMGCFFLMCRDEPTLHERGASLLHRVRDIPDLLDKAAENLSGVPKPFAVAALEACDGALDFFQNSVPRFGRTMGSARYLESLEQACSAALAACNKFRDHIETVLLPGAPDEVAIGRDSFDYLLRVWHLMQEDSVALLEFGEQVVAETKTALEEKAAEIDPGKSWQAIIADLKLSHPAANEVVSFYATEMERARRFIIERNLVSFPGNERLSVVETPAFQRGMLPYAACLPPAAFAKEQHGQMWVTPIDPEASREDQEARLQGHSKFRVAIIALHEAYPGHHLQFSIANQHRSPYRRHFGNSNVFCEGWALYCEEMMYQEGFYGDEGARLMQLKEQLWRACRVVIDVKLHTGEWSPAQCAQFLVDEARLEVESARVEVQRYCANPTQPMSYMLGKKQLLALRADEEKRKGDKFNLREFHDEVLSHGTIPFRLVREEMAREI
jgi:uncharacterized protein (DUF885 family)